MYPLKRLELFGSASRDDFDLEKSDLDFLVAFGETHSRGAFDRYFGLKEALEQLFQRPIDLGVNHKGRSQSHQESIFPTDN